MVVYPVTEKSTDILKLLHDRRRDEDFCDVKILLGPNKSVNAHKALLASQSEYFESMFHGAFVEAVNNEVDLSEMSDDADLLENIINSFYGKSYEVNEDNVADSLNIATMFMLTELRDVCETVLCSAVKLRNAAYIFVLAVNYDMKNLLDKVLPTIQSRFHDYIVFKDDILVLPGEHMSFLLSNIDTKFVADKTSYIKLLLNWYVFNEDDERASLLLSHLSNLTFDVTGPMYRDLEEQITDVIEHLSDVNSDVLKETSEKLEVVLVSLRPQDYSTYLKKISNPLYVKDKWDPFWRNDIKKQREQGPPEPKKPEISKDQKSKASKDEGKPGKQENTKKKTESMGWFGKAKKKEPKDTGEVKEEVVIPPIERPRLRRIRTDLERSEIANFTRGVIVITPSVDLLEGRKTNATGDGDASSSGGVQEPTKENILDVGVYIPDSSIWYRLCTIDVSKMPRDVQAATAPDMMLDMDMEEMMMQRGPEEFEMMMMMDMPRHIRHRMMERGSSGRQMHPRMMMKMMRDMEMDDDMPPHARMMMHEMHRRNKGPPQMMAPKQNIQPPTEFGQKDKWTFVYLREALYFFNNDACETALRYDIVSQTWSTSCFHDINPVDPTKPAVLDGVTPIVIIDTLYAVVRVVYPDHKDKSYNSFNYEKDKDITYKQRVKVAHRVFRMNDDKSWEFIVQTKKYKAKMVIPRGRRGVAQSEYSHQMAINMLPLLRQHDCFRTALGVEDEDTLHIFLLNNAKTEYDPEYWYKIENKCRVSLDLKESEVDSWFTARNKYIWKPIVVKTDTHLAFFGDELKVRNNYSFPRTKADLKEGRMEDIEDTQRIDESEFQEALKKYPLCPNIVTGDGHSVWALRGQPNDITEMVEVKMIGNKGNKIETKKHAPPPFRAFTLATGAQLDRRFVESLRVAGTYMHT